MNFKNGDSGFENDVLNAMITLFDYDVYLVLIDDQTLCNLQDINYIFHNSTFLNTSEWLNE